VNDDLYKIRSDIDTKQQQIQKDEQLQAQLDDIEQIQVVDDAGVNASGESLWTFVGTFQHGEFKKGANFQVLNVPEVNQTIKAVNDVNLRSREPRWTFLRGWTMGTIQDVIKKEGEFLVDDIEKVPAKGGGHRIWVRGRKVSL